MLVMVIRAPPVSTHDQGTAGLAIGAAIGGPAGVAAGCVPVFKGRAGPSSAGPSWSRPRPGRLRPMQWTGWVDATQITLSNG